jgi:hypothetical protein
MSNSYKPVSRVNQEEGEVYKTPDFVLAVFLLYSGVNLIKAEPYPDDKNQNRKMFVFEKTDQLEDLMGHFISTDPTVKIKKVMSIQKNLKKMIYDGVQLHKTYGN